MMNVTSEVPRRSLGRYSYPTSHRVIELVAVAVFAGFTSVFGQRTFQPVGERWGIGAVLAVAATGFAAFVVSDVATGVVHALCDNFGSVDTPIVGQKFIRSFREHHTDPMDMTRGDFVRVNADNFLACLFVLVPCALWLDVGGHPYSATFVLALAGFVVMTNQIHKWAHLPEVPAVVAMLQRRKVILAPDHHQVHHTAPYDTHYCITSGIANGPLARLGFWTALVRSGHWLARRVLGSPAMTGTNTSG